MSIPVIAILATLNVVLIYFLMAAPVGLRTVTVRRTIRANRRDLWNALWPLGDSAGWDGKIQTSVPVGDDGAHMTLSWPGRDGNPIERIARFSGVDKEHRFSQQVVDDSSLENSFWEHYCEQTSLDGEDGAVTVTISARDRYHGVAFMIFRFFSLRRTINRLKHWAETGELKSGGIFERPITQFGFAVISALLLWPLFGLNAIGFAYAATLTLVVALHELGHMAAFRLMGHGNVRMIFIPILGGIAIGGRPYDRRYEIAFVALMGAGLSALLVLPAITASEIAERSGQHVPAMLLAVFAGFCALFNLANLVPVWRFDGGQVLRQLFQNRAALAATSFALFAIFMGLGLSGGVPIYMIIVAGAVFAILSIVTAGRSARPRYAMKPMSNREWTLIATGLLAVIAIHGAGVLWAAQRILG